MSFRDIHNRLYLNGELVLHATFSISGRDNQTWRKNGRDSQKNTSNVDDEMGNNIGQFHQVCI